jgi:hypothetical protein
VSSPCFSCSRRTERYCQKRYPTWRTSE